MLVGATLGAGVLGACAPQGQTGTGAASTSASAPQAEAESQSAAAEVSAQASSAATSATQQEASSGQPASSSATGEVDVAKTFPSWNPSSASLAKLIDYVKDVTDKGSPNYVEPEERLATFDMDGTLMSEKAPVYVDYCLLFHRVFDDPTYQAPAEYVEICQQLRANADRGIVDTSLDDAKNATLVGAFKDMAPEEFREYVTSFIDTVSAEGFEGMTYGQSIYKPMAEVVDYLRANEFEVYIVSACEREVARAIGVSKLDVEPDHIIGTDYGTKATGQGEQAANEYTLEEGDELVFDGTKALEVAKLNKVVYIEREIGKRPLLAFGNSSGDYAMLNYAQDNPDRPGMGLLVICDDLEREYGDAERAAKQVGEAAEAGWTTFSMANDWATIYGQGVTKTQLVADAQELAQAA